MFCCCCCCCCFTIFLSCSLCLDFKKTLDMHCTAAYNSMEAAVYNMYDRNNATIQDKLHELFEVLERTGKI